MRLCKIEVHFYSIKSFLLSPIGHENSIVWMFEIFLVNGLFSNILLDLPLHS